MKIVVLDGYALNPGDLSWDGINKFGELIVHERTSPEEILLRSLDADVLFTNKTPIRENIINQLAQLKFIGVLATGYNIIDVDAATKRGVIISNIPNYGSHSVAQLTLALLLELCHHVQRHSDTAREGKWAASKDWCYWDYPLVELTGKTMGIIGFGNIGQKVADIATAFGMNIIGAARTRSDQAHRKNFSWAEIPDLLQQADVASIHCPLTPETKGLINSQSLRTMKKSAFLLNTSRGPIIVDEDLALALNHGVIAGAGIDVLSAEPPAKDNPLFKAKNCIITPHIAWATKEARARLMNMAVNNLEAFVKGAPTNVVRTF
ncbi:MAG: D-2-hydroxyacid dehydrogenase [Cyclobacteriaceae bacterium]